MRKGGDGIDAKEREVVDISVFQQDELLTVVDLRPGAEMTAFVEFATELDDGEAAACAMAVVRRGALVSDDRKARNVLSQRSPNTRILTTCEMMQTWAESVAISRSDLAKVLRDIEERASFRPGRNDPLWEWWQQIMNTDSLAE
ncbi:MAG: hypothetical protein EXR50_03455 [Dehalococcoidia bacterium]|nr:hypothetical protein [Dehalococcoidia bacterium]